VINNASIVLKIEIGKTSLLFSHKATTR